VTEPCERILLIENCDFRSFPPGGQLSFARNLIRAFGDRLALVGAAVNGDPVGRWIEREFEGRRLPFLAVGRLRPEAGRPLVPARLRFWLRLQRYRRRILASGARHAIALAPETMMALGGWGLDVCYHFSGVENPLRASRYGWARPLARWFEAAHLASAGKASLLLAHAAEEAVEALAARSNGKLARRRLHAFPTCVDCELFRPRPKLEARRALGLAEDTPLFVSLGRISRVKGWPLLLEALACYRRREQALLCFVGDGEDRARLEARAAELGLAGAVRVTGFEPREAVARWLNAADVAVFGSLAEGWSNAMLEALASGKPVVTTAVSGAREMVREGVNGFVLAERDPEAFAWAMGAARALPEAERASVSAAGRYGLRRMASAFRALWPPLAEGPRPPAALSGQILGIRVEAIGFEQAVGRIIGWAREGRSRAVCLATVYSVMLARDCPRYRRILNEADLVLPDGMPLVWGLRRQGFRGSTRVAGPDLAPPLLAAAEKEGIPVGFYGARPEVLAALLERVRSRYPRLRIAYAWSPPFRPLNGEEDREVVGRIRESGARILLVGLGTPKQDLWVAEHRGRIPAVMLGVGQVFDLLAGTRRRAPGWMCRWGLEWLYRLVSEPRRLWRRYLPHNPRFLWLFLKQRGSLATAPARAEAQAEAPRAACR
jgi:N-acetylglucosaminyldiphosphoundecaprenol N-acetyl-beta-D-mannosaminyltransferase